ncbi:hypothetical protein [Chryseobacterium sp. MP_3.2]|uniref:hypothetical protein n=1 Tax=Chryseobacterium sp. MP_3.2 TaxID=3071712 RepID=UPI002DFF1DCC|nr:hypothetical protein [Chryseobacterium sp. MP_3.2]
MKNLIYVLLVLLLASCNTQKKYSNFDYSFARSGGLDPIYENLWIRGNSATYSFEGRGEKINKTFKISPETLKNIEVTLAENNFRMIQEDYKKLYDNVSTSIVVKKGDNSASKSNASQILERDQERWNNVASVYESIIQTNVKQSTLK